MAKRLQAMGKAGYEGVVDDKGRWSGRVNLLPERLELPLHWKKPRRVFVDSMSDLFHPDVPFEFIDQVFEVMGAASQHTFQLLTKRPARMLEWFSWTFLLGGGDYYPNVWLGVSVSTQQDADELITLLLQAMAAVRFVSYEPALGPVNLPYFQSFYAPDGFENNGPQSTTIGMSIYPDVQIDWVITGCESGPGARPMELDWARSARDQCQAAGAAFFLKQLMIGGKLVKTPELDGRRWIEYP
jgi:protein gp37